ncbi:MAG: carbon-nitrogen family hydrolase [Phycisphaerales bacterium]|nr:carbon-nitrogen family hydrolase [Phycisphaerales bacterium]
MHLALVQLDITWEDKPANHTRIEAMLDEGQVPRGSYVVLPELGDTGFSFALDRIVDDRSVAWATGVCRRLGVWMQVGHAVWGPGGRGRNRATIVDPSGRVAGHYEKVHPFSYGREVEHFTGGDSLLRVDAGAAIVCPLICYDLRFPELFRLAVAGVRPNGPAAEVFTLGASWPDARQTHWRALAIARAIENQAYVAAVNRIGRDPHLAYAGGSIVVDPAGDVIAEAGDEATVLHADLDLSALRAWRRSFPALADIRPDLLGRIPTHDTPPASAPPSP